MVTLRRTSSNCCSLKSVTSSPSTKMRPESAFINPMMCFSETDFPTPLRPIITQVSPRFTVKLTSFSTAFSSKDLQTSRNSKKFSACCSLLPPAVVACAAREMPRAPPVSIAATPRLISFASVIFVPLPRCVVLPRNPPPYSCSKRAALRYQIVSSPARQELPRATVQYRPSLCELLALRQTPALQPHPFASKHRAAQGRSQTWARQLERNFRSRVQPDKLANP